MDKLDLIIWMMGSGFTIIFGLMIILWNGLNARIDKLNERIDKLSEKVEDVDRRLCRIEGSLSTQGHCLFNQSYKEKKAE